MTISDASQSDIESEHTSDKTTIIKTQLTGPNYDVEIDVNNRCINAYIDTGSVIITITEGFVRDNLEVDIKPIEELGEMDTSFYTANGDKFVYIG